MSNDETAEYMYKNSSQADADILEFYLSGEPEITQKYRLKEYNGSLEINHSRLPCAGRGLFLNRPVKAGEIILISMAQASCIRYYTITSMKRGSDPGPSSSTLEASTSSPQLGQSNGRRVCQEVHDQLALGLRESLRTSKKSKQILNLDHHTCDPTSLVNDVEVFKHQKNAGKISAPVTRCECATANRDEMIRSIVAKNASYDDVRWCVRGEPESTQACEFWGVWLLPSLINHSCFPNCTRSRVGEALIIRAAKDLVAEEELTLAYFDVFKQLKIRQESSRLWFFKCECPRCLFEGSLDDSFWGIEKEIMSLNKQLKTLWHDESLGAEEKELEAFVLLDQMRSLRDDIDEIKDLVIRIEETKGLSVAGHDSRLDKKLELLSISKSEKLQEMRKRRNWDQLEMKGEAGKSSRSSSSVGKPLQLLTSEPNRNNRTKEEVRMRRILETLMTLEEKDLEGAVSHPERDAAIRERWIPAAFLDTYIAAHSLICNHVASYATIDTMISMGWMVIEVQVIRVILYIIISTDRGNLLGEEYCRRIWKVTRHCLFAENCPEEWRKYIVKVWPFQQKLIKMIATANHGSHDPKWEKVLMSRMVL